MVSGGHHLTNGTVHETFAFVPTVGPSQSRLDSANHENVDFARENDDDGNDDDALVDCW